MAKKKKTGAASPSRPKKVKQKHKEDTQDITVTVSRDTEAEKIIKKSGKKGSKKTKGKGVTSCDSVDLPSMDNAPSINLDAKEEEFDSRDKDATVESKPKSKPKSKGKTKTLPRKTTSDEPSFDIVSGEEPTREKKKKSEPRVDKKKKVTKKSKILKEDVSRDISRDATKDTTVEGTRDATVDHEKKSKTKSKKKKKKPVEVSVDRSVDISTDERLTTDKRTTASMVTSTMMSAPKTPSKTKTARVGVKQALDDFVGSIKKKGAKGLIKEFKDIEKYPSDMSSDAYVANEDRNRYDNVICLDQTRVLLTLNVPPESDYVHANWVKLDDVEPTFIAAQGPLDETIGDFWRLCYQETVTCIVMLCNTVEKGEQKCAQYWPLKLNGHEEYGHMRVSTTKVQRDSHFTTYTVKVMLDGFLNSVSVKLIHMVDWPDRGVPKKFTQMLRLLHQLNDKGTCLVHCSAGVGRTGTAIGIQAIRCRLFKGICVETREFLEELRSKRAMSIQTAAQYLFLVSSVLEYIKVKVAKRYTEDVNHFQDEARKYLAKVKH